ncbi:MAG TPA: TAT-variant-translocated molybdopterin oxidoreductase [Candidatus Binatia bacterium]|nr:TAT-variant-translocated molybdopterin oxidoreductase [Candidatus Binatia bacterium]
MSDTPKPSRIDLAVVRQRLAQQKGRELWRSLDELAGTDEFAEFLAFEFPRQAAGIADASTGAGRRDFLKLMSASLALAGLSACTRQPEERIVPYVRQPDRMILGKPLYYATAMPLAGYGTGLLIESHEGRPTKAEGNPLHPSSLGATGAMAQGSVLGLYDPDRAEVIMSAGQIRTWDALLDTLRQLATAQRERSGAGLRLLTGTVTSPSLAAQIEGLLVEMPQARWHQWEPVRRDGVRLGARQAFGEDVDTVYRLEDAAVILTLDSDLIASGPGHVRYAREVARGRRPRDGRAMNRLYAVESTLTVTGAKADHRLPVRSSDVEAVARAIAAGVGVPTRQVAGSPVLTEHAAWIAAVTKDLQAHRGAAVVVAGEAQPPAVHALAHAMNEALGAVGKTVVLVEPIEARPEDQLASLRQLADDMDAGTVECLIILGGNPVYDAPVDVDFAARLQKVGLRIHLSQYDDETAELAHWHVPEAHYLETWGDVRGHDGTVSVLQPLIAPLYGGRTATEVVGALRGEPGGSAHDMLRAYWRTRHGGDFEAFWQRVLHDGVVPDSASPAKTVRVRQDWDSGPAPILPAAGMELVFRPDPNIFDGRFGNNPWLQELPKPLTKLTWENVAQVAPANAEQLGIRNGDVVELTLGERTVRAPVWVQPGQAKDSVSVQLGYGRSRGGAVVTGIGFDATLLRTVAAPDVATGLAVRDVGERRRLACTQDHQSMEGRPLVRRATEAEYRKDPHFAMEGEHDPGPDDSMFPPHPYPGHAWGMAIDLTACIGCNACVAACVAENNISVVGQQQVADGREMHWLRIDRYFAGGLDSPKILSMPVPCMHCENAPCEVVCPVNATVHSSEGLNDMVYNRCVGTRYCSNNCPYKVRRFNYFLYADWHTETLKMARNPDVTVRSRGVMEKCTYCVQRIEEVRITAANQDRPIRDGEIRTACQQACPTEAIVFGDINEPSSQVARMKADTRNYSILAELNTRPRTTYLAGLDNPNPELEDES